MRLGMFMHPIVDFKRGYHTLLLEAQHVIKTADRVGFDEVWLGEHFALPSEPFQSPLMLMASPTAPTSVFLAREPTARPASMPRPAPGALRRLIPTGLGPTALR